MRKRQRYSYRETKYSCFILLKLQLYPSTIFLKSFEMIRQKVWLKLVSCPATLLEEEGSGNTRGFFGTGWNAISAAYVWLAA